MSAKGLQHLRNADPQPLRIDQMRGGLLLMAAKPELTSMLPAKLLSFGTLNTIDHTWLVFAPKKAA